VLARIFRPNVIAENREDEKAEANAAGILWKRLQNRGGWIRLH
jgi:hypothetical protein